MDIIYCRAQCRAVCDRNLQRMKEKYPIKNWDDCLWFDFSLECPNYDPLISVCEEFGQETDEAISHD